MKKHEPYYPVVGGAAECIHCGKQNYNPDERCERHKEVTDEDEHRGEHKKAVDDYEPGVCSGERVEGGEG